MSNREKLIYYARVSRRLLFNDNSLTPDLREEHNNALSKLISDISNQDEHETKDTKRDKAVGSRVRVS